MTVDDILERAGKLRAAGQPFAIATVVRAVSPIFATVGAQAIIEPDGTIHGWIGGGCAKGIVTRAAQAAMQADTPKLVRISNDGALADAGVEIHAMPCASNGTIELFIQPHMPAPLLLVMGNTPCAREAAALGQRIGLRVATAGATTGVPDAVARLPGFDAGEAAALAPRIVLIATQGEGDEAALEAALRSPAQAVLLVASARKAERLRQLMGERGIAPERLADLHAPAGPDIGAAVPEEVALATVAGVVACLRGAQVRGPAPAKPGSATTTAALHVFPAHDNQTINAKSSQYANPVCRAAIDKATALHVIEYGGMSHYFCCDGCKVEFERDPAKYLEIARQLMTTETA